ncbi:MAG TPA: 30S ribosome-binding factor RbfA [Candidatus Paceibacterota bacterium]|nr:30S ribosome-binding factor RbfA [Candidatus Paceibacterota bacterium]HRY76567.1 30S ribosome-binding factor RbfA [Candidatus Paceibacterota bacterium]
MESFRIKKVNKLILELMGQILQTECQFPANSLVTILGVETSKDLLYSKITMSVFPAEKRQIVLNYLNKNIYELQQFLNKKLDMHPVPKIRFALDTTEEEAAKIERLLKKLKEKE